jgi:hypothetical protein
MNAIYFARFGDFVKIGIASNPAQRVKTMLNNPRLIVPDDLDRSTSGDLILVVPFCKVRDERNMHLLFARHWVVGEWFHWSPEFRHQMQTMRFVTDAVRRRDLRRARRDLGVSSSAPVKEEKWGKSARELIVQGRAS